MLEGFIETLFLITSPAPEKAQTEPRAQAALKQADVPKNGHVKRSRLS